MISSKASVQRFHLGGVMHRVGQCTNNDNTQLLITVRWNPWLLSWLRLQPHSNVLPDSIKILVYFIILSWMKCMYASLPINHKGCDAENQFGNDMLFLNFENFGNVTKLLKIQFWASKMAKPNKSHDPGLVGGTGIMVEGETQFYKATFWLPHGCCSMHMFTYKLLLCSVYEVSPTGSYIWTVSTHESPVWGGSGTFWRWSLAGRHVTGSGYGGFISWSHFLLSFSVSWVHMQCDQSASFSWWPVSIPPPPWWTVSLWNWEPKKTLSIFNIFKFYFVFGN